MWFVSTSLKMMTSSGRFLIHLDLWNKRNPDPPVRKVTDIPELTSNTSDSQFPQTDYWLQ